MSERVPPIRSELLAAKIEKLLNFELPQLFDQFAEEPRFIRALWFLEFVSKPDNYAGGLTKFANDLIDSCIDAIGTPTMTQVSGRTSYKPEEAVAIFREMREYHRAEICGDDTWIFENAFRSESSKSDRIAVERFISCWETDEDDEFQTWTGSRSELHRLLLAKLTPEAAGAIYVREARESLAEYFKQLCELPHVGLRPNKEGNGSPDYFVNIGDVLLNYIENARPHSVPPSQRRK